MGKPDRGFFQHAVARLGLVPKQVVMIGDDVQSDILGEREGGAARHPGQTGKYRSGDEHSCSENIQMASNVLEAVAQWLRRQGLC